MNVPDLLDGDFYVHDPYSIYARLRREQPVAWDPINELWGVFRYDDIVEIERRKDVFISSDTAKGGYRPNLPADNAIIGLDDPAHALRRNLVARRFTPRAVTEKEPRVRARRRRPARRGTRTSRRSRSIADLASPLPAMMIGWLLGYDEADWPKLRDWSERTIALGGGPRYMSDDGIAAFGEFITTTSRSSRPRRRARPTTSCRSTRRPRSPATASGSTRRCRMPCSCSTAGRRPPVR